MILTLDTEKWPHAYIYFGYANSWSEYPEVIQNCRAQGHKVKDYRIGGAYGHNNEVRCDICRYMYRYDSS